MGTALLLRLPRFVRSLCDVVSAQHAAQPAAPPSFLNKSLDVRDLQLALLIAALLLAFRLFLNRVFTPRIFAACAPKLQPKLSENLFYSVYYTLAFAYYMFAVRHQVTWSVDLLSDKPRHAIVDALLGATGEKMMFVERTYYAQAAGFYLSATVFLLAWDGRRTDFAELFLHHVVTIALIGTSYAYGYIRPGVVILALHDVTDVLLYSAKLVHHMGMSGWDSTLFGAFAAMFYVTRLVMFPRLVYAVAVETLQVVVERPRFGGWARWADVYIWHYVCFVALLGTLALLHCFWFALIVKMIYREIVLGKKVTDQGDIRSDDEGDDSDEEEDRDDGFFEGRKKEN